jgi:ABC-type lipoprotein release transport system permease subunit
MQHSTLQIAWRNLGRNRKRTLLAVGAIALGQLTLVFVNCMMAGSFHNMTQTVTGPLIGHVQIHHDEWREERAIDLFIDKLSTAKTELATIKEVRSVSPRIYAPALVAPGEESDEPADAEPAVIVGIDVAAESGKGGVLEFVSQEEAPGGRSVLVGKVLARRLGMESGQLLAVIGQDADGFPVSDLFEVAAVIRSNVDVINTLGVVMAVPDAGEFVAMPDQAHEIIVQGGDYENADTLAEAVAALPSLKGTEVITWKEAVPQLVQMLELKNWFDLIFVAIVFVAAAAGIANTALMSTFERTREFGMLLAMGSRPRRIIGMVVIEAVILGLIGVAIGSAIGSVIVLITSHTGIDYAALGGSEAEEIAYAGINISYIIYPRFEFRHVLTGLCAVTLTSVLASLWPACYAARLEPVEAMHK